MALKWFGSGREATLPELIAQKKYARAIELLREQFAQGDRDPRMRMQLGDVLVAANRTREAIPIYLGLADDFAHEGFLAKAVALLKKIDRIDPGRPDVERRMARFARQSRPAPALPLVPPSAGEAVEAGEAGELGVEELGFDSQTISVSVPRTRPATPPPLPPDVVAAPSKAAAETAPPVREEEIEFEEEFFQALEETVTAASQAADLDLEPASPAQLVDSPLFGDFAPDELLAVMQKLQLQTFDPGDIVVSEGEPGASLFVLTTGTVKAFVRDPGGRSALVREMGEGSFFGEISILSGSPRTATVTCATNCELLELDRAALDEIAQSHPHVRQVLEDSYRQRAGSRAEMAIRQGGEDQMP